MTHGRSCLVETVVLSRPVEKAHREETMKNGIHDPLASPLDEDVSRLHRPQPERIVVVKIVGHVVVPICSSLLRSQLFVTGSYGLGVHPLIDLHRRR